MAHVLNDNPTLSPVHGSRRGKPGRPRADDLGIFGKSHRGHTPGTAPPEGQARSGGNHGAAVHQSVAPVTARLFDLAATSLYLAVSEWTVRDLEASGVLARVRIPLPNGGELRKLLFDRADLDRLVEHWKDPRVAP